MQLLGYAPAFRSESGFVSHEFLQNRHLFKEYPTGFVNLWTFTVDAFPMTTYGTMRESLFVFR